MAKCLMPLRGGSGHIVPSLRTSETTSRENPTNNSSRCLSVSIPNPTIMPPEYLAKFQFCFLIRTPRLGIPSLYECSTPPKSSITGWHGLKSEDAGYRDIRTLLDYLIQIGQIGPGTDNEICIVDAEELLACPEETVENFCLSLGIPFDRGSLTWGTENDLSRARAAFKNWAPFHDAVLKSTGLIKQSRVSACLLKCPFCSVSNIHPVSGSCDYARSRHGCMGR